MKTSLQTYWSRIRPGRTLLLTKPQGPPPRGGLGSLAGWKIPLGLAIFLLWSGLAPAQSIDPTFNPAGTGPNDAVRSVAIQADGKVLIGGNFTQYNGTARNRIARLNADGSLDTSFDPGAGANSDVYSVAVQADGKVVIGGIFDQYNGTSRTRIARLNANGSLDTNFDPGLGFPSTVTSVAVQADGKVLVGGGFTRYNGPNGPFRGNIARLNTDGSLDTSFDSEVGANGAVRSVVVQADGKVLIGGIFRNYNTTPRNRIARINADGSVDLSFDSGLGGANDNVNTVAIQADGKVLIGGIFTRYNDTARRGIARLNANGSLDTSFNPESATQDRGIQMITMAVQADGKVLIGYVFNPLGSVPFTNGPPQYRIARLNADGSLDTSFNRELGLDNSVSSIVVQADGKILMGGFFTQYNGTARRGIARLVPPPLTLTGFVANPATVCTGSVASFTATVQNLTGSYSYTLTTGTSSTTGTATSATFSQTLVASGTGPQTVTLTVSNGSQLATASTPLTVNAPPVATLTSTPSATLSCGQTSLTLTAGGGTGYFFSGPGILSQSGNQAVINAPGSYSVNVTNAGCPSSSTSIAINQDSAAPAASLASSGTLSCAVTSVTLTSNPGSGLSYVFSSGATQVGTSNQAVVNATGTYSVTVISGDGSGCSSVASTTVTGDQTPPTVSVSPTSGTLTCSSPSLTLSANTSGSSLTWSTGQTSAQITVDLMGTYSVTATSPNGCSATSNSVLIESSQSAPPATLLASDVLSCAVTSVTLTANPGSGLSYVFSSGATQVGTSHQAVVNASGPYSVTVTSANGCSAVASTTVTADQRVPVAELTNNGPISRSTTSVTLTASGGSTYRFSTGATQIGSGPTATVSTAGIYSVTVVSGNGCSAVASTTVTSDEPVITALSPTRNARNAPATTNVAITFDQSISSGIATLGAVRVFSQQRGGLLRNGQGGSTNASGNTLTFDPTTNFRPGETILTTVTAQAQNSEGASLARGQVHQFTVGVGGTGVGNFTDHPTNPNPAVGSQPRSVAMGDVDGDGDLDLLTANTGNNNVSVRLNDGSGNFTAPATNPDLAVGDSPQSVALGDVDGDGDLDLLTANSGSNTVSVQLNDGSGNFTDHPTNSTRPVGDSPQSVALGDVDGDGDLDLLTANSDSENVSVLLNDGSGNFTDHPTNPNPAVGTGPRSVAMGDVDGDGDLDLLTANYLSNNVSVLLNDGSGSFTPPATNPNPVVGIGPRSVALGDVDGDGDLDLLTANEFSDNVSVLLNDGSGNFTDHPTNPNPNLPVGSSPYSVVLGDGDGDGDLDLLTANPGNNNVSVLLNDGSGNFTPPAPATNPNPAVGTVPRSVVLGDVDGDGDLDLLTANEFSDNVSVLLNQSLDVPPTIIGFNSLDNPVCVGSPLTFTATVGNLNQPYAFTLSNGSSTTLGSAASTVFSQVLIASGSGLQTFTLTVSSQGQSTTATTSVTVNALPVAGLMANGPLSCSQPSVILSASGEGTYQFSSGASQIGNGPTATVSTAGVYSVTVTSTNGCSAMATTTVSGDQTAPTAGLTNDGPLSCTLTSVTLTATGGATYRFSGGATQIGSTNQALVSTSGPYSVTVTSASGCTAVAQTTVTGDQIAPEASLTQDGPLTCSQTTVTLTAGGGVAYAFSPGATPVDGGNTATVNTAGIYSVTVTAASGCTAVASLSVSQDNTQPVATLSANLSATLTCSQTQVALFAGGGDRYVFSGPGFVSQEGSQALVNTAGVYSVTVTNSSTGCFSVTSITVSQEAAPHASLTASPSATLSCAVRSVTLTAGGGNTGQTLSYAFAGPGLVSQTGNQAMVNTAGVYSLTVTNTASGCSSTTTLTIDQNTSGPEASLASSGPLTCAMNSVTLTASPAEQTYQFSAGATQLGTSNQATVSSPGLYSVTVVSGNGCTAVVSLSVSQDNTQPVATLSANPSATLTCSQTQVALFAGGGNRYVFAGPGLVSQEGSQALVNTAGVYSVTVTNSSTGCFSVTSITIDQNNTVPDASLSSSGLITCATSSVTLTASPNGLSYAFAGPGVVSQTGNQAIVNVSGTYSVTVTNTTSGCFSVTSISISQDASAPVASLVSSGTLSCAVTSVTLTASPNGLSYMFSGPGIVSRSGNQAIVNASGLYSVTVSNGSNGCSSVASVNVMQDNTTPIATISASPSPMLTCTQTSLTLTAGGGNAYRFSGPGVVSQSSNMAVVNASGPYSVTVTNTATGCFSTTSITITQDNTAPSASLASSSPLTCAITSVTLTASPDGQTYVFSPGASPIGSSNQATVSSPGLYSVTVISANGCSAIASVNVSQDITPPVATISGNLTLTSGRSTTLTASGGTSQRWSTGETTPSIVVMAGTYSVTVTNASGCSSSTSVTVSLAFGSRALSVLHQDVSFGQTTTNTILPYLQLANSGSAPIAYSAITVRYWLTVEGNSPITNFQNYYVQIGANNVHERYVPLATPRQGATAYVEYSFDAAAGSLGGGTNSGPIQNGFTKGDYSVFNQSDDYSYAANRDYVANARITAYVNGVLVYGQEPSDLGPVPALMLSLSASPTMLTTGGTTTLSAMVSGGSAPYSYSFTGPGTITPSGNTASVSGLPAGVQTYTVVVRDATSPTSQTIAGTVSVTVTQAPVNTAPVATANNNQTATVGVSFNYPVNAFTDAETPSGLTYQVSINPANGLSFDPVTRIISGTPSMSGVSSVTVTATDPGSLSASTTFSITVSPAPVVGNSQLTVLHQDVSFGQTTTTILPYLQLANSGSAPLAYQSITVRYWLTVEGNSPITNFQNYYVQIGANNVHERYVPLATPRQGATAYVEYSFDAAAGSLGGGANSGPIQNGFTKADYSAFEQGDDYSYAANRDYTANTRITAYVNGVLVYGQEPPVGVRVGATTSEVPLRVQVLGNPLVNEVLEVMVSGGEGQSLVYQLTDTRGRVVVEQRVDQAGSPDHQRLSVRGQSAGVLLLRVSTPRQSQTVKVLKRE